VTVLPERACPAKVHPETVPNSGEHRPNEGTTGDPIASRRDHDHGRGHPGREDGHHGLLPRCCWVALGAPDDPCDPDGLSGRRTTTRRCELGAPSSTTTAVDSSRSAHRSWVAHPNLVAHPSWVGHPSWVAHPSSNASSIRRCPESRRRGVVRAPRSSFETVGRPFSDLPLRSWRWRSSRRYGALDVPHPWSSRHRNCCVSRPNHRKHQVGQSRPIFLSVLLACPFRPRNWCPDAPKRRDDQAGRNQQASSEFRRAMEGGTAPSGISSISPRDAGSERCDRARPALPRSRP
jgi:hypothetical protein